MDFSAFSHGQIHSKLWLCQHLEHFVKDKSDILILGSWYNVLGLIMLVRKQELYNTITGIDINQHTVDIADKICDAFMINHDQKIVNKCAPANDIEYNNFDIIVNTSCEDMIDNIWYEKILDNQIICLQSNNLTTEQTSKYPDWKILNPNPDMDTFKNKYPMSEILFQGEKEFDYGDLKYTRYMIIGKK